MFEHVTRAHAGTRHVSHGEHAPLAYFASRFLPRFLTPALRFFPASLFLFFLFVSHTICFLLFSPVSFFLPAKFKCTLLSFASIQHLLFSPCPPQYLFFIIFSHVTFLNPLIYYLHSIINCTMIQLLTRAMCSSPFISPLILYKSRPFLFSLIFLISFLPFTFSSLLFRTSSYTFLFLLFLCWHVPSHVAYLGVSLQARNIFR